MDIESIKENIVNSTGYTAILEILIDKHIMTKEEFLIKQRQVHERLIEQVRQLLNSGMSIEEIKKLIS